MAASPLAFFRGAAAIMAHDLAAVPTSGVTTQICGDAHLLNFGLYATPERRLVFDLNDFDETAQGPWEWDLLRLSTSVLLAARQLEARPERAREAVAAVIGAYRAGIDQLARATRVDAWFTVLEQARLRDAIGPRGGLRRVEHAFHASGSAALLDRPPVVSRTFDEDEATGIDALALASYTSTLTEGRELLVRQYRLADVARKVVGIGSVGLRCFALLLTADEGDHLLLQVKQATRSVVAAARAQHEGRRVIAGQRVMQAASDPFLGWLTAGGRAFHVRQLHDYRYEARLDEMRPKGLVAYAALCGDALALGHGRAGAARAIEAMLAPDPGLDARVAAFAERYADQTERDHAALAGLLVPPRAEPEPL
jgi:uncharacterized protein (DUF2252 family)